MRRLFVATGSYPSPGYRLLYSAAGPTYGLACEANVCAADHAARNNGVSTVSSKLPSPCWRTCKAIPRPNGTTQAREAWTMAAGKQSAESQEKGKEAQWTRTLGGVGAFSLRNFLTYSPTNKRRNAGSRDSDGQQEGLARTVADSTLTA